uniref:hypermethylated in cancer 2 protein n=1 Tax=Semicossyphus pulcher TaxID=241346 RepID=UPI0037E993B7
MNGAVYISFFQGQLESVLEQVVQLAVQEISKTVGSSLNTLLLETAVKEQENHRLRLQLQSWENRGRTNTSPADSGGSPVAGRNKAAGDERADRTKPEQRQQQRQPHAPGGQGTELGIPTDTRRLEQRGRVVDQLKSVMEQVLDFAVRELTKIVEASFDDLLLEITKMEREQQGGGGGGGGEKGRGGGGGRRRGSENDSVSPSGSEDAREELTVLPPSKEKSRRDDPEPPPVLSVSQDWVPILDKVFGQRWCSDGGGVGGGGRSLSEGRARQVQPLPAPSVTLEPSPSSPQQDPRWTPLEDMEVFSPDEEEGQRNNVGGANTTGPSPGPPLSPTGSSGRRSSASMLHRLLTLPSQLLEDDDEAAATAAANETLAALATNGEEPPIPACSSPPTTREEEEEEEEEEEGEEDKGRKKKRRRVWSECEECGRRFSRMSLLKAHRQAHIAENAAADTSSPSSPPSGSSSALRCSECGKRFSSATRLHSHVRTQHPGNRT